MPSQAIRALRHPNGMESSSLLERHSLLLISFSKRLLKALDRKSVV